MARGYRFGVVGSLSTIPDGKTVLPVNDIDLLLQCAGIKGSTITTLAELFADTTTLQAVVNSNNAIDYLVRSTSFASENPIVPKMTSNTMPSGECIASSNASNQEKYKAFDDDTSTQWSANSVNYDGSNYIGYNFGSTKKVAKAIFTPRYLPNYTPVVVASVKYQGSNDGTNWTDVSSAVSIQITTLDTQTPVETLFNNTNYQYYRAVFLSRISGNTEVYPTCAELQFYENAQKGFCDNSTAMTYIGANNYASNTLISDTTWLSAIASSPYIDNVLNKKNPTMTNNTTPSGVCISDGYSTGYDNYRAFNGTITGNGWFNGTTSTEHYVGYQFTSSAKIYAAKYNMIGGSNAVHSYDDKIQGSNDGLTWTDVSSSFTVIGTSNDTITGTALSIAPDDYTYYRLYQSWLSGGKQSFEVKELQFYGRQDV